MGAATLIENKVAAAGETAPPRSFAAMPPRRTLEALLQSADKRFPAARSLSMIAIATTTLALIAAGFLLHAARPVMLPLTTAFVISLLLAPAADWLGRRGLPEGLRAAAVVLAAIAALLTAFYFLGRPAAQWFESLPEIAEEARQKLSGVAAAVSQVEEVSRRVEEMASTGDNGPEPQEVVLRAGSFTNALADGVRAAFIQIVFTAVLVYFLLATRSSFRLKAIAARPTVSGKLQTARLLRDMQKKVGSYMFTMLIINFGLAAVVAAGMAAIGMPSPLVWGALAGALNFVPYLGPAVVTILLGVAGVVQYDTLAMAAAAPAIYIAANFIESNLVTPMLVGVRLRISPLAIFVAVSFLAWLWGPVGAVIAIPLVVVTKTVCDAIEPLRPVGVLIGEIEVVKGRKFGFCRIETTTKRRRAAA